jgi:outer membrane immunogenic protein
MRIKFWMSISTLAAVIAGGSAAGAADLAPVYKAPVYKAPVYKAPMAVLPYNWTGFYVGATVGGVFGDWSYSNPNGFNSATNKVSGVLGGPTLGYNWQTGPWVLGVEGDWSWSDAKASDVSGCSPFSCDNRYRWFATARGRVGYAFDRFLPYVTVGGAFTHTATTFGSVDDGSKTFGGWTAGAGVEWAFWQHWSAKVEYLHMDFGDQTIFNPAIATNIVHHDSNLNVVRAGLNYKF